MNSNGHTAVSPKRLLYLYHVYIFSSNKNESGFFFVIKERKQIPFEAFMQIIKVIATQFK